VRQTQTALSGGELDPALHSHSDLAKFQTGVALADNWHVIAQGGMKTRSGTAFVGETPNQSAGPVRLVEFEFNVDQTYVLVLHDLKAAFVRDTSGSAGYILETGQNVISVTLTNPCVVEQTGHLYANGDMIYLEGLGGTTELNGRYVFAANVTANTYELVGIDATGYTPFTTGGTGARVYQVTTAWSEDDIFGLKFEQSADVLTVCHPDYAPQNISRVAETNWTVTAVNFGTSVAIPTGVGSATQGTASGSNNKTYRYIVTAVDDNDDESTASASTTITMNAQNTTWGARITWTDPGGIPYWNVYKELSYGSQVYGWIGEAVNNAFDDFNLGPDMAITPPLSNNPFGGADDYPGAIAYHQERRGYGGSNNNPTTFWLSKTALYENMRYSRPLRDDDSFNKTLNARRLNRIEHMLSHKELLLFTSGGEFVANAAGEVLTPSDVSFKKEGGRGSGPLAPQVVGESVLYIQARGTRVRDLNFQWEDQGYSGDDLTILARHLFEGKSLVDWCYQEEPYSLGWVARSDGTLLCLTYLREHRVFGWTQCHLADAGKVKSLAAIPEGTRDAVYLVAERVVNSVTKLFIERMADPVVADLEDYVGLDCSLEYDGAATDSITGMWHLESETVWVLVNGAVYRDLVVTDGTVTLPPGTACTRAIIGLQYNCDIQTLEVSAQGRTVQGRKKSVAVVTLRVKDAKGLQAGRDAETLHEFPERTPAMGYGMVPLSSGTQQFAVEPSWTETGQVYIRQENPVPSTILAITPELAING